MSFDNIPLLSMIKGKMGHITERQRLIAQNVANADTPGYMPTDLKPFAVTGEGPMAPGLSALAPVRTNGSHLEGTPAKAGSGAFQAVDTPDTETSLNGNHVVLEDEMMKMTEARVEYEAAVGFYQQSLNLLQTAARAPGK